MLKKIVVVLGLAIAGFVAFVATRPDNYRVERSQKIAAPADVVFAQLDNFKSWAAWSPWDKRDPNMKKTFDGPARGVGASYSWEGNDKVGQGKMTITEMTLPKPGQNDAAGVSYRLEFIKPFASIAGTGFVLKPEGDKAVTAVWFMDGHNNLMGKAFGVFMNMDKMIGDDFDKGLASLKTIAEAEANKPPPPPQAAAAP